MCEVLILLAGGTSFDIVSYPLVHIGPPVTFLGLVDCFISARVAGSGVVMHQGHDTALYLCDGRDMDFSLRCNACDGKSFGIQ